MSCASVGAGLLEPELQANASSSELSHMLLPADLNCPPQTKRDVRASAIAFVFFTHTHTHIYMCVYTPGSESVKFFWLRDPGTSRRRPSATDRRQEDASFFLPFSKSQSTNQRMRRKHGGMSVAYFHIFAYFSERRGGRQLRRDGG